MKMKNCSLPLPGRNGPGKTVHVWNDRFNHAGIGETRADQSSAMRFACEERFRSGRKVVRHGSPGALGLADAPSLTSEEQEERIP